MEKNEGSKGQKTKGHVRDNGENMLDPWADYSQRVGNQITGALEEYKNEYAKLYNGWVDFSRNMGTKIREAAGSNGDPQFRELFNVWKNYSNKMNARLNKVVRDSSSNVETLSNMYNDYTETIRRNMPGNGNGSGSVREIYGAWFDFSNYMNQEIGRLMSNNQHENGKVFKLWDDFTEKMSGIMDSVVKENESHVSDVHSEWNALSEKFGETITEFLDEYKENYENVYQSWVRETRDIGKQMTKVMKDFGADYETLFRMYFDRTAGSGMFPFAVQPSLTHEIRELRKKVDELEKKLKK